MEQITKVDGKYFYGHRECYNADDAYRRFRDGYNYSVGRVAFKRLSRLGSRKERIHGYGFVFSGRVDDPGLHHSVVPVRLLGIVSGSYCRMLGQWDIPGSVDESNFDKWFDWAFSSGSGAIRLKTMREKR